MNRYTTQPHTASETYSRAGGFAIIDTTDGRQIGWTRHQATADAIATLASNPNARCRVCGQPLAKCRSTLGMEAAPQTMAHTPELIPQTLFG